MPSYNHSPEIPGKGLWGENAKNKKKMPRTELIVLQHCGPFTPFCRIPNSQLTPQANTVQYHPRIQTLSCEQTRVQNSTPFACCSLPLFSWQMGRTVLAELLVERGQTEFRGKY